jgi:U4/U6.U5 tri-snRNP-associated protein 1
MIDVTHFVAATPALVDGAPKSTAASKPRFAPVGSFVANPIQTTDSGPGSGAASPAPTGGRIALNLKRKAEDEGTGTPPMKRR